MTLPNGVILANHHFCVYFHCSTIDNKCFYVGSGTYSRAFDVINRSQDWLDWYREERKIIVMIIETFDSMEAARRSEKVYIQIIRPMLNIHHNKEPSEQPAIIRRKRGIVTCDQTLMYFTSISAITQIMGISGSAVSNHLNGKKGYNRVHGYTFTRGIVDGAKPYSP